MKVDIQTELLHYQRSRDRRAAVRRVNAEEQVEELGEFQQALEDRLSKVGMAEADGHRQAFRRCMDCGQEWPCSEARRLMGMGEDPEEHEPESEPVEPTALEARMEALLGTGAVVTVYIGMRIGSRWFAGAKPTEGSIIECDGGSATDALEGVITNLKRRADQDRMEADRAAAKSEKLRSL